MVSGLSLCCVTVTCNHGTADCAMFFVCGPDTHIILFEAVISEEGYLIFIVYGKSSEQRPFDASKIA